MPTAFPYTARRSGSIKSPRSKPRINWPCSYRIYPETQIFNLRRPLRLCMRHSCVRRFRRQAVLIKKSNEIPSSEITPEHVYRDRRRFLFGITGVAAAAPLTFGSGALARAVQTSTRRGQFDAYERLTPERD